MFSGVPQGAKMGPLSSDVTSNLPDYWDWRLYGAVSQVKDQVINIMALIHSLANNLSRTRLKPEF